MAGNENKEKLKTNEKAWSVPFFLFLKNENIPGFPLIGTIST